MSFTLQCFAHSSTRETQQRLAACFAAQRFITPNKPVLKILYFSGQTISAPPVFESSAAFLDLLGVHGACEGRKEEEAAGEGRAGTVSRAAAAAAAGRRRLVGRLLPQDCRSPPSPFAPSMPASPVLFKVSPYVCSCFFRCRKYDHTGTLGVSSAG